MLKIIRNTLFVTIALALGACNFLKPATTTTKKSLIADPSTLGLTIQVQNATDVFNTIGQVINYNYVITYTGSAALAGPATVTDAQATVACPDVNTVGNQNSTLDQNEIIICKSAYSITQADLDLGSVTKIAMASIGGVSSSQVSVATAMIQNKILTLTKSANPVSYSQLGQAITFTYVIKNTGTPALGPAQFIVKDDRIGAPINCGGQATTLATNESVTCTAIYTISQSDISVNQITSNATASGGGAGVAQPTNLALINTNVVSNPGIPSTSLAKGSTIQHKVVDGEWLLQIARCYGADFNAVRNANSQVIDPNRIKADMTLTIPNIGSNGIIYGPPCIGYHTVQSGDTWNSIAQKYNADIAVLQGANSNVVLSNGIKLKVPLNSAGGNQPSPSTGAIRINIPAGSTTAALSGTVNSPGTTRYVLSASQGQTLNVKITIPTNDVNLIVSAASNGTILKQSDANLTWSGTIPANGDYFIDIISLLGTSNKSFSLEVSLSASASPFERAADINSGAGNSNPAYLTVFNGTLFFKAEGSDNTGAELWKYDSALKAASRVVDISAGAGSSDPSFLAVFNGALYFKANGNDNAGAELWRFNGSAAGRLTDINAGPGDSNPSYLAVYNNELYFSAKGSDGKGVELWKTDGNTANRVTDINPEAGDSNPAYLAVYNNVLYFSATSNDGTGTELWKYDGTTTSRVADINSGAGSSNPAYLTVYNNVLYFSANGNDGAGIELWKYDGTNASRAADINNGPGDSIPAYLAVFNGALYFSANGNDGTGVELWKYDGSNAKRVSDINKSGDSNPAFLAAFNNELFFQANGGDGAGVELWKFKGP